MVQFTSDLTSSTIHCHTSSHIHEDVLLAYKISDIWIRHTVFFITINVLTCKSYKSKKKILRISIPIQKLFDKVESSKHISKKKES